MDIKEKAKEYAEGKALESISMAIQDAYAAGYKDGYNDGYSSNQKVNINDLVSGIEFMDLGLPSGTKWATDYLRDENGKVKMLYYEEARLLNLPNPLQFREFLEYTRRNVIKDSQDNKYIKILGANGNKYNWEKLKNTLASVSQSNYSYFFWLKDMTEKGSERNAAKGTSIINIFTGYKLPVILVR